MIGGMPMCEACVRLRRKTGLGYSCDAFPGGIPAAIMLEGYDHHKPFAGDHGLRFAQDPDQPAWEGYPWEQKENPSSADR